MQFPLPDSPDNHAPLHLVIGASGQVGEHLLHALRAQNIPSMGTYCSHPVEEMQSLDVRDAGQVGELLARWQPSTVYLPASLTNVDWCESHPDDGYAINVQGVAHVAQAAQTIGAKLVYFSSDYIFDGRNGPYSEDAPANPLCEYGRQKLCAEHYAMLHAVDALIIRTTVVYGWERQGKNFIQRLIDTLQAGKTLRAPVDQIGSPTYAPDLARAVVDLVRSESRGVYHVAGPDLADRFQFACQAARVFDLNADLIEAVSTAELKQTAPRPLRAGMNVEKANARLGRELLGYDNGLRLMADEQVKENLK